MGEVSREQFEKVSRKFAVYRIRPDMSSCDIYDKNQQYLGTRTDSPSYRLSGLGQSLLDGMEPPQ